LWLTNTIYQSFAGGMQQITFILMDSNSVNCNKGEECTIYKGESVKIGQKTLNISFIDEDEVILDIGGGITEKIKAGDTASFSGGTINILDIDYSLSAEEMSRVTFKVFLDEEEEGDDGEAPEIPEIPDDEEDEGPTEPIVSDDGGFICEQSCLYGNVCFPLGIRKKIEGESVYCDVEEIAGNASYIWNMQKEKDSNCENNFECRSNLCIDDECINQGFFRRILEWFKNLFGG